MMWWMSLSTQHVCVRGLTLFLYVMNICLKPSDLVRTFSCLPECRQLKFLFLPALIPCYEVGFSRPVTSSFWGPIWLHIHHQKVDDVIYVYHQV